jgi:hypothetical protein
VRDLHEAGRGVRYSERSVLRAVTCAASEFAGILGVDHPHAEIALHD